MLELTFKSRYSLCKGPDFRFKRNDAHIYKFSQDKRKVIPETAIGIWNKYEDVARNYDERFLNQLEKMKRECVTNF